MSFLGGILGAGIDTAVNVGLSAFNQQNNLALQNNYFQGQQNLLQKQNDLQTGAFTKYGLPAFMAYQGSGGPQMPSTYFNLGGSNFYRSGYFGSTMPTQTNMFQQMFHWGDPLSGAVSGTKVGNSNSVGGGANSNISSPPIEKGTEVFAPSDNTTPKTIGDNGPSPSPRPIGSQQSPTVHQDTGTFNDVPESQNVPIGGRNYPTNLANFSRSDFFGAGVQQLQNINQGTGFSPNTTPGLPRVSYIGGTNPGQFKFGI